MSTAWAKELEAAGHEIQGLEEMLADAEEEIRHLREMVRTLIHGVDVDPATAKVAQELLSREHA
tara:strand:- start:3165 stop:3356 length:192 start_codon:yes stop_codon:yes gene_type:complete